MNFEKFEPLLGDWAYKLKPFIESEQCDQIYAKLKADSQKGKVILPASQDTFRAFKTTPYKNLKVVFLMYDPYPWVKNGVPVADGIALSCKNTGILQPALEKFYEGIEDDTGLNLTGERKADLEHLCVQGCMMLNTALTVEKDKVGSHYELWKPFTTYLFEEVFAKHNKGLIFVLCGKESHYYEKFIFPHQHYIIKLEHPAAAAHQLRMWKHEKVFSSINKLVKENYRTEIVWIDDLPFN
jgi:uracil-DNA glycosylase